MNSSNDFQGKAVIISAPSGAGKTTLVNKLLKAKLTDTEVQVLVIT